MSKNMKLRFIVLATLLTLMSAGTFAQEFRGTVSGTVEDPNGAVVTGATVVVKNRGTNVAQTVTTNDDGAFTVPFLSPGEYDVTVTNAGFKSSVRENLKVSVDDRITLDFKLEIGTAAEVSVSAGSELIEQGTVTVGTSVSQRQIEELPLAEGAPYTLATQAPGVVYTGDPNFQGPTANGNLAGFRTNGTAGNQINLDGSPNLAYSGQVAFTPPSDAVQEFKVQTNSFDAGNGFTAGATVNVAIKSGTNKLHGAAYLFDRNKNRTANNFFNNRLGRERPDRQYNRYGGVISGPVFKDKTFFLFSYERQKDNVAQPTTYSVPSARMRNGDFTEMLGAAQTVTLTGGANCAGAAGTVVPLTNRDGSPVLAGQIYNPFTGISVTRCNPATGTIQTAIERLPVAGNIITSGLAYAPALAFLRLFPAPNQAGLVNNYVTDQNLIRPYRSYLVKIDHNFNSTNRIFGKYYHSRNTEDRYNLEGTPDSITRGFENRRNNGMNINYTSTISSDLILDIRGSWNQFRLLRYQDGQPTAADLGFTGIPSIRQTGVFPRFDFRNYMTLGSQRADYNNGQNRPFDLYSIQPSITQIYGNHTFKYGYDFRKLRERFTTDGYSAGRFFIDGTYTTQASNSSATLRDQAGRDLAAFIFGVPVANGNSLIDNPTAYDTNEMYMAGFFQDDWRIRQNITLNLGLRYDYETGVRESESRIVKDFVRDAPSPIAAAVLANYNASVPVSTPIGSLGNLRGGLIFTNSAKDPNQKADTNNFQPRLGFSWGIDDKTVVRAGFGTFTQPFQIGAIFQPGFSSPTLFVPSTNNGVSFIATLGNAFPAGILESPGRAAGLATFYGRDVTANGANGPTSSVLSNKRENANYNRFMIGIQRELPGKIGIEFTYVYSRGNNLAVARELNAIPLQYLNSFNSSTDPSTIAASITAANTFLNATVSNPFRGQISTSAAWNATTIQRRRLLTPFPQYGNIAITEYNGTSDFQSFAVQIVKRFTKGLSMNGSYTYSREHQKAQYLNPQDTELTDIVSPTERPHRFTATVIYELPFGRKRQFGSEWHPILDAILGGWQTQAVYEWQSGEPLQFGNVYFNGDPSTLVNLLGKKDAGGRRYGIDLPAFDTSGFFIGTVVPGFGNNFNSSAANTVRTMPLTLSDFRNQRFLKFDVGISKNFRIREGMKFQVRFEAINIMNQPYFSGLNLDPTNAAFGLANTQRQPPRDIQIGGKFTF